MRPGSIAYFPEGTRYGPQKSIDSRTLTLVLQMGGPSGNGYMSEREFQRGLTELKAQGRFENGVFTRVEPDGGRINGTPTRQYGSTSTVASWFIQRNATRVRCLWSRRTSRGCR